MVKYGSSSSFIQSQPEIRYSVTLQYFLSPLNIPVLRLDVVSHGLGILVWRRVVAMSMVIIGRAKVLHLVNTTALRATFNWAITGDSEPNCVVRVGWTASAPKISMEI